MDHMQASCACRPRLSLSSSTSSCSPVERNRSFQRWRFCLGQSKCAQETFHWTKLAQALKQCRRSENFWSSSRKAIRCRVIRDERNNPFASIARWKKQALPSTQHWPTLLPLDYFKEEPISEVLREDSSRPQLRGDGEVEDFRVSHCDGAPLPLDSWVEIFEGIPVRQWLSTFVESVDPRLRGIITLNILTFLTGTDNVPLQHLCLIALKIAFRV